MPELADSEMTTFHVQATELPPGKCFTLLLKNLKDFAWEHKVDLDDWGVCEYENRYWVGCQGYVDGKQVLRASLLDLIEQKEREYPEWGDEEIYIISGRKRPEEPITWFLLNKSEIDESMEEVEFPRSGPN
jgi:hypothetical protein